MANGDYAMYTGLGAVLFALSRRMEVRLEGPFRRAESEVVQAFDLPPAESDQVPGSPRRRG